MIDSNPPRPPQLARELLGTFRLPDKLVEGLSGHFRATKEDGETISMEQCTGRGLHAFLSNLAYGVEPVPGFPGITLFGVDRYRTVHLTHSLLSIPVGMYSTSRRLFSCLGELPDEGLPTVVNINVETFTVRCYVCAIQQSDHTSHLEGATPPVWHSMIRKRVGKIQIEVQ